MYGYIYLHIIISCRQKDIFRGCWKSELSEIARSDLLNDIAMNDWQVIDDPDEHEKECEAGDMFDEITEEWGPSQDVQNISHVPIALFFKVIPKSYWRKVAVETTKYELQTRSDRMLHHAKFYSKEQHDVFLHKVSVIYMLSSKIRDINVIIGEQI